MSEAEDPKDVAETSESLPRIKRRPEGYIQALQTPQKRYTQEELHALREEFGILPEEAATLEESDVLEPSALESTIPPETTSETVPEDSVLASTSTSRPRRLHTPDDEGGFFERLDTKFFTKNGSLEPPPKIKERYSPDSSAR